MDFENIILNGEYFLGGISWEEFYHRFVSKKIELRNIGKRNNKEIYGGCNALKIMERLAIVLNDKIELIRGLKMTFHESSTC